MKVLVSAAMALAAAAIAFACIFPGALINRLYNSVGSDLNDALELALDENNPLAYERVFNVNRKLESRKNLLMIFYDHSDVIELTGSAEAALELAKTKDTAQLIVELRDIEKAFEVLIHTNDASIYNVF